MDEEEQQIEQSDCGHEASDGRRSQHWVFTQHNYDDIDEQYVFSMWDVHKATYVCCGREICPETKTPHLQGVVSFPSLKSWKQMRDILPDAYWKTKVTRSTFKQWSDYTKKDGDFYEEGTLPLDPKDKGEASKRHWEEQLECVREKRYKDMHPQVRALHLQKLEYAVRATAEAEMPPAQPLPGDVATPNEWHWGVSGCGKSEHCKAQASYEVNIGVRFWTEYSGGNIVCDEITRTQAYKHADEIKKWGHRHTFKVDRKNLPGAQIRPPRVFITSQDDPTTMFKGEHLVAIKRRYRIVYWPQPYWLNADPLQGRNPLWRNPLEVETPAPELSVDDEMSSDVESDHS